MKTRHPIRNMNVGHPYMEAHPKKESHPMRGDSHPRDVHPIVPTHP